MELRLHSGLHMQTALNGGMSFGLAKSWGAERVGSVPELTARELARLPPDERTPLRFLNEFPSAAYSNVLRHICWDVLDSGLRKVVAVCSANRQEGASATALAIAAISASIKRKTVLVECDLRARTATLTMGLDPTQGVWEVTRGEIPVEQVEVRGDPFGFSLLPAARSKNLLGDLYSGPAASKLMETLRDRYDCVVLDLPPVFVTVDAAVMAQAADVCLLVARHRRTNAAKARRAFEHLRARTQAPLALLQNFAPSARIGV